MCEAGVHVGVYTGGGFLEGGSELGSGSFSVLLVELILQKGVKGWAGAGGGHGVWLSG